MRQRVPAEIEVVVSEAAPATTPLWTAPAANGAESFGNLVISAGDRYPLLAVDAGEEDTLGTSAEAYRVWYQIALPRGGEAWVQATVPVDYDTGSDGRPSSVQLNFLPAILAN